MVGPSEQAQVALLSLRNLNRLMRVRFQGEYKFVGYHGTAVRHAVSILGRGIQPQPRKDILQLGAGFYVASTVETAKEFAVEAVTGPAPEVDDEAYAKMSSAAQKELEARQAEHRKRQQTLLLNGEGTDWVILAVFAEGFASMKGLEYVPTNFAGLSKDDKMTLLEVGPDYVLGHSGGLDELKFNEQAFERLILYRTSSKGDEGEPGWSIDQAKKRALKGHD